MCTSILPPTFLACLPKENIADHTITNLALYYQDSEFFLIKIPVGLPIFIKGRNPGKAR